MLFLIRVGLRRPKTDWFYQKNTVDPGEFSLFKAFFQKRQKPRGSSVQNRRALC